MENANHGAVLELGRRLFNASFSDDEMWNRLQRWFCVEYGNGLPFTEFLHDGLFEKLLRLAIDKVPASLGCTPNDDGSKTFFVATPTVVRPKKKTKFNGEELDALRAYLDLRINGIGIEPQWQGEHTPLWQMIHWIEELPLTRFAIDSEEFRSSVLHCVPPETIPELAQRAGLSLVDAKRLSFRELVVEASRAKPDVTIQMLIDHSGCGRQKLLNVMKGHSLTKERRGKPDWFVYAELRPLLPKGFEWPLSASMLKQKQQKTANRREVFSS